MSEAPDKARLDQALQDRFGLERFRAGQREVIAQVLQGRDVLCVMPTGGGKSLCYQLPAVLLPGVTLVVSPLIALMKDQVDTLLSKGLKATLINSTLELAEQNARMAEVEQGRYDLVYVAPERFRSGRFVEMMARTRPALLAVDEAHCISEWGHDFRPDYARLGQARKALGMPPCIALTATATDLVRRDIADQLELREPSVFVTGFDRPNLTYGVEASKKDERKLAAVAEILGRNPGPAIVYASSRKRCEAVGEYLTRQLRRRATIYHAGLGRDERSQAQERFMSGEADVVVATNAFGMGVDKADIRSVIHFNMPGTLEAYYQEAGRAGRDGGPAECVLLYSAGDRVLQEMFIDNEYPPREAIYRIYDYLRGLDADPIELTQAEIRESVGVDVNETGVGAALKVLEGAGGLERFRPRENMAIIRIHGDPEDRPLADRVSDKAHVQKTVARALDGWVNRRYGEPVYFHPDEFAASLGLDRMALTRAIKHLCGELSVDYIPPFRGNALKVIDRSRRARDLEIDFASMNRRKDQEYEKLERMIRYAQGKDCRRAYILGYFGDTESSRCGRCDNCGSGSQAQSAMKSRPIDTPAGRELLQKILSGVARTKGRFGKTAVGQMLVGSGSEKMERSGLTRLSTFGILANVGFTQKEVVEILDALTASGAIVSEEVERFVAVIKLSDEGWAWIRNPEPPPMVLGLEAYLVEKLRNGGLERVAPPAAPAAPVKPPAAPDDDAEAPPPSVEGDPLWQTLKDLRLSWAKESNVKAFQIFGNRVLEELVRVRPTTPHALAQVKGIGPITMEKYGPALLAAMAGKGAAIDRQAAGDAPEVARDPAPRPRPEAPAATASDDAYIPTEEWTWRLLDRGFTVSDCAAIRGLDVGAIVRHALWMARKGRAVPLPTFLDADTARRWQAWLAEKGETSPPPEDAKADRFWPLFVACTQV